MNEAVKLKFFGCLFADNVRKKQQEKNVIFVVHLTTRKSLASKLNQMLFNVIVATVEQFLSGQLE